MPTARRPWSTQYGEDFNKLKWKTAKNQRPKSVRVTFRPQVCQETSYNTRDGQPAYGGEFPGLEDPLPTSIHDVTVPLTSRLNYTHMQEEYRPLSPDIDVYNPLSSRFLDDNRCMATLYGDNRCMTSLCDDNGCMASVYDDIRYMTSVYEDNRCMTSVYDDNWCMTSVYEDNR
ncbi:hypothetical protein MAR_025268 [Mya arenaria]|uniref:Uncharacterized protein n=1 Tax=Mya arenaria TaxID=6604 RepID=A0ABY7E162_MYAAR|nr:hypothetical protein MAR_025268 [Mya arenaria]